MTVTLVPVTGDNWRQVITVEVTEEQRRLLDSESVLHALAEGRFHPTYSPYAIYQGDTLVGFASYGYLPENRSRWWIPLLVIDRRHQGRGHGRAAMEAIVQHVRLMAPDCRAIGLSYKPENSIAERLYLSLGFELTGDRDEGGEVQVWLDLRPAR